MAILIDYYNKSSEALAYADRCFGRGIRRLASVCLWGVTGIEPSERYIREGLTSDLLTDNVAEPLYNSYNSLLEYFDSNRRQAKNHLEQQRVELSFVINDVAIHVLEHCDFQSFVAFSKTSKKINKLCREHVFPYNIRAQICKFSLRNISYRDYLLDGHLADLWNVAKKAIIIGVPIYCAINWYNMDQTTFKNISPQLTPEYFEKVTRYVCKNNRPCYYKVKNVCIHPEANKYTRYVLGTIFGTQLAFFHTVLNWRPNFNPGAVQLVGITQDFQYSPSSITKFVSPDFAQWRLDKLRKNISAPQNWRQDPVLGQSVCMLTDKFAMFPVVDRCGHTFDYLEISAYMRDNRTVSCPLRHPHNENLMSLRFDTEKFDQLRSRIEEVFD